MNKLYDGIIGLVVGDALGVPVEFKKRDSYKVTDMIGFGTYNQPPGTWSDDSSMTLATLESIVRMGTIHTTDIMNNFYEWLKSGKFTPHNEVFDFGGATRRAIVRYVKGTDPIECGGKNLMDNGNGALMRILPVAILSEDTKTILNVAHLTHAHFISDYACLIYAAVVKNLFKGMKKQPAVFDAVQKFQNEIEDASVMNEYSRLPKLQQLEREEIRSSGYVVDTLEAALWCFLNTDNYRDCVLLAVNLGEDTDTVAAVAGGLAGIYYGCGENSVLDEWIAQIARKDWIKGLCDEIKEIEN